MENEPFDGNQPPSHSQNQSAFERNHHQMAGMKGRSGGARANTGGARPNSGGSRPGAGRKPKPSAPCAEGDPLEFLRNVWTGQVDANATQLRAAAAALPFVHQKLGEGGKKAKAQTSAVRTARKFPAPRPPGIVVALRAKDPE
jgi:phage terminase small subunit